MPKASARFTLRNLDGKHDEKQIKQGLDTLPGVCSVSVSGNSKDITVDFDTTGVQREQIEQKLEKMGYEISNTQ